jgi:TolA-binding protein
MDTPEPLYFSGMNYYKLGDTARAKARFREVMELYPLSDNAKGAMSMLKLLETR